jgi:hypothetical protein
VSHAAGVKMEPVKVDKVIHIEKGKDLVIMGFKFRFQKILADDGVVQTENVNAT